MPLIEGLGDEVTLLMGAALLCIVITLAWFSTHTTDLPALREVGITVIERTQIRRRVPQDHALNNQNETNVVEFVFASSNVPERAEGLTSDSDVDAASAEPVEASAVSEDANLAASAPTSFVSDSTFGEQEQSQTAERSTEAVAQSVCDARDQTNVISSEQANESLKAEKEEENSADGIDRSSDLSQAQPSTEHRAEEVRRRRVHYYQNPASTLREANHATSDLTTSLQHNVDSSQVEASRVSSLSPRAEPNSSCPTDCASSETSGSQGSPTAQQVHSRKTSDSVDQQSPSSIRVKLKYMNETQRLVHASPLDTIGDFRRTHFQTELQEGDKWVRFIFNGQDLRNDEATLQAYQIGDNCTMHCLITNKRLGHSAGSDSANGGSGLHRRDEEDADSVMGALMYPLFTLVLAVVWYFRFTYRQYFSPMSTVCLIGISFLLGLGYFSSLRTTTPTPATTGNQQQPSSSGREGLSDQNHSNQPARRRHEHAD
ncbi:transmembrane and ubiquitin-like domain-containing protein 1 [Plakobranchus ocellatus]|uniref:Transmembrane and ubiquitin-like domain-containing protein 1 n=1 Tax=Plakobranchus ocellatus TaxID=259542 RepID=A0AAV4CHR6_9GAST|nr:transmembrane and ubiquitin-like domain-containing protein 1 [Plakobranchus ocellatus]